jgi:hypothetical protein
LPRDKKPPLVEELLRTLSNDGGRLLKKAGDDDGKTFWSEVSHDVRLRKGAKKKKNRSLVNSNHQPRKTRTSNPKTTRRTDPL